MVDTQEVGIGGGGWNGALRVGGGRGCWKGGERGYGSLVDVLSYPCAEYVCGGGEQGCKSSPGIV